MQTKIDRWFIALLLTGALLLGGCTSAADPSGAASPAASAATITTPAAATSSPAATEATLPRLTGEATVEMTVKGSPITIRVDGTNAPFTGGNFVDLVNRGVYDGLSFHRVERQPQPFVVQGGDPQSKDPNFETRLLGTGGFIDPATSQPRYIPLEIKPEGAAEPVYHQTLEQAGITKPPMLKHTRGAIAMARSQFPDSASSQFYFTLADLSFLDGNYAVFGYVTAGMDVVDQIQRGDRITSARVTTGLDKLQTDSPVPQ